MRLLLDSHAVVWWEQGTLGDRARAWLESAEAEVFVSAVTAWELGIKHAQGRLELGTPLREIVEVSGFNRLPVTWLHAEAAAALPRHHRDPWDRMLVAQAQTEGLSLVTSDRRLARYAVHTVPAR
ncbi:MAG TPA: type II toxin-antitoxin system VapC family toxin [Capillimicrobium sp.]